MSPTALAVGDAPRRHVRHAADVDVIAASLPLDRDAIADVDVVVVSPETDPDSIVPVVETATVVLAADLSDAWRRAVVEHAHVHHVRPDDDVAAWLRTVGERERTSPVPDPLYGTLDEVDTPVCVYDADGRVRYANPAFATLTERPREAVLDGHAWEFLSHLDRATFGDHWASFDPGEIETTETTRGPDESATPVEVVTTRTTVAGRAVCVATVRSIERRERALSAVRENQGKLERLHAAAREMERCESEQTVYDLATEAAEDILELDLCTIGVVDDGVVELAASTTEIGPDGYVEPPVDSERAGLGGKSIRTGETYLIHDLEDSPDAEPIGDWRSAVSVPIGDGIGVFQAVSASIGAFDSTDKELVELLVAHVADAVGRIRSRDSLRESQRRLSTLMGNLPGIAYRSTDGDHMTFVSEGCRELLGCPADRLEETSYEERIDARDRDDRRERIDAALADRDPFQVEYRVRTETGERRWVWEQGQGVYEDGDAVAVEGFVTDVTERHERRAGLQTLQETARTLMGAETADDVVTVAVEAATDVVNCAVAAVWVADGDRLRPRATAGAAGVEAVSSTDDPLRATWSDGDAAVVEETAGLAGVADVDRLFAVPLGEHGCLGVSVGETVADHRYRFARILGASVETALDRAARERELARQNDRLDEFASVVSHDLRNPINVARGYVDLARTGDDGALDEVAASLDRMEAIVDDVLTLARRGGTVEDATPVSPATVAETAWDGVATAGLSLSVRLDPAVRVEADRERLCRLFENLFRNAADHAVPEDSEDEAVTVTVAQTDDGIAVADDGVGIPPDERESVLDRGYTTSDDGTGFGLAIVAEIAAAHGWSLEVSESEDGGARFELGGLW